MLLGITGEHNRHTLEYYPVQGVDVISATINPLIRFTATWPEALPSYALIRIVNQYVANQTPCEIVIRDVINRHVTNVWILVNSLIVSCRESFGEIAFGVTFDHISSNSPLEFPSRFSGIFTGPDVVNHFDKHVNWSQEGF